MIGNTPPHRILSATLLVVGALLIFLAPEDASWIGVLLLVAGMVIDLVGFMLGRNKSDKE